MNTNLVQPMKYHLRFLLLLLAAFSVLYLPQVICLRKDVTASIN